MKIKVYVLNYDSEWVLYCDASSRWLAECAVANLQNVHNFQPHQIKCEL